MTYLWLVDELRAAGLTVVEHPGWQTHDRPGDWSPRYGLVHATAAPRTQPDETQVRIVRDGRSDLPGPIANATVDRQGRWHVLSAGRCNSTLAGTAGPYEGLGNTYALSTEACNDNLTEPWPDVQYRSYVRGWAAWCRRLGWTADRIVGHKEHTPGRKTDPTFSMVQFRRDVARILAGEDDPLSALTDAEQRELLATVRSIKHLVNVAGYRVEALVSARPTYDNQMGNKAADNRLAQQITVLGEAIALESSSPDEVRRLLAELPAPPAADDIADEVLAGLGARPAADVAAALVAAGQDPAQLAAALTALAGITAQP